MRPVRKQIRLQTYDYSAQGAYFITICSHNRECTFGTIVPGDIFHLPTVCLSPLGEVIRSNLEILQSVHSDIHIEKSVIMPNHLHLLLLVKGVHKSEQKLDKMLIPKVIRSFKASVSKQASAYKPIWQERYHDRVVRDEQEFQRIWTYIENNPELWLEDQYYAQLP